MSQNLEDFLEEREKKNSANLDRKPNFFAGIFFTVH